MSTLDGNPGSFGASPLAYPSVIGKEMFWEGGGLDQTPGSAYSTLCGVQKNRSLGLLDEAK